MEYFNLLVIVIIVLIILLFLGAIFFAYLFLTEFFRFRRFSEKLLNVLERVESKLEKKGFVLVKESPSFDNKTFDEIIEEEAPSKLKETYYDEELKESIDEQYHIQMAENYLKLGEIEKAIQFLNIILNKNEKNINALIMAGLCYSKSNNNEKALDFFNKALSLEGNNPTILNNIGNIYLKDGKFIEALSYYEQAIKIKPNMPILLYNRACALSLIGKTDEAIKELKNVFKLDASFKKRAKEDPDLEKLKNLKEFSSLFSGI